MQVRNMDAAPMVARFEIFTASHIFSREYVKRGDGLYAVFSYRETWPMFVFHKASGVWYENSDKFGVTTSKQQNQMRPVNNTVKVSCQELLRLVNGGVL